MAKDEVDSSDITLRFKHGKQTILLFADALTPFKTIKEELLSVLRERYQKGLISADEAKAKIPSSANDIILGVPKDQYDHTKGWSELDIEGQGIKESPRSLGVKDGGMVAFRFKGEPVVDEDEPFYVEFCNLDELYPEDEPEPELVKR